MNTINGFMPKNNRFSNRVTASTTQTDSLNRLLELGETMIVDKKFDIKKYLNTAENHFKLKKINQSNFNNNNNLINFSTDYLNYKKANSNNNFSTFTNYNTSINSNSQMRTNSFNDNKSKFKNYSMIRPKATNNKPYLNFSPLSMTYRNKNGISTISNNFNQSINNKFPNYNYLTIKNKSNKSKINKKYSSMFNDKDNEIKIETEKINNYDLDYDFDDDDDEEDNKLFKIEKVVKDIKRKRSKHYDLFKHLDNIKNNYDKKDILIGLDSEQVLNNYKVKQKKTIKDEEVPLQTFITQNKEISINNLLIKLINKESNKLVKKEQELTEDLKSNKYNLETDEKKFEEYSDIQKVECKKIEKTLFELQQKNKDLMNEEKRFKLEVKIKEYEIHKILVRLNLLRYYAKFSNTILDGDPTRFEEPILPDMSEFEKFDLEPFIKKVINNYSSMKKFDIKKEKTDKKDIKFYKEEGYFLYDPELMNHKFNEIEDNIIRLLTTKENLIAKNKNRVKQNNEALSYLIDKCNDLQKEYDELCQSYEQEKSKFLNYVSSNGNTHINVNIYEKNNLIFDLYMNIIKDLEPTILKLSKKYKKEFIIADKKELVHFDDIIKYGLKIVENIELFVNQLLSQIKSDEEDDQKLFDKVIYGLKNEYKLIRQNLFFKNRKEKRLNEIKQTMERAKKIVIVSKKSEPPYYKIKKKEKEVVDESLIKSEEDRELMTYK